MQSIFCQFVQRARTQGNPEVFFFGSRPETGLRHFFVLKSFEVVLRDYGQIALLPSRPCEEDSEQER